MIKNFFAQLAIILVLMMTACVEPVDVNDVVDTAEGRVVVEGKITNEAKSHTVRLTRSTAALSNTPPPNIVGATVTITDGENEFVLTETDPGYYVTDPDVKGESGKLYTLKVVIDGQEYIGSDRMPAPVSFTDGDKLLIFDKYLFGNPREGFTIEHPLVTYGALVAAKTELQVLSKRPRAYNRSSFYDFPGIDSEGLVPTIADQLKFMMGDTLQQSKLTLSEANYKFLRAVLLETKFYGGVLSSVPANVPSNMSNGALGFFSASSVVTRKSLIQ